VTSGTVDKGLSRHLALQPFSVHGVQAVAQLGVVAWEQVAVAVQREADRGVPGPHGDLLGRRASGDPQRHGGVAKIVDAQAL